MENNVKFRVDFACIYLHVIYRDGRTPRHAVPPGVAAVAMMGCMLLEDNQS